MREKKRYLLVKFEREPGAALRPDDAKRCVYQAVNTLLGEAGAAKARALLKEFDEPKQLGILKCATSEMDRVIAALALKTDFEGKPIAMRLQKISGMIGKLEKAAQ